MTKLTPTDIANRADSISGSIDDCRRALAELALEAKESGVEEWAEIIAKRPRVRRSVRTIRDYAVTADFCRAIGGWVFDLPYSFYSRAASMLHKLSSEIIVQELTIAAEGDSSYELFSACLRDAVEIENPNKSTEPTLKDALLAVASSLTDLGTREDLPRLILPMVQTAVGAMNRALSALEKVKVTK